MPSSSKPRKPYRPKPVIKPCNTRQAWEIEGEAHIGLLAIESGDISDEHIAMVCAHADMVRRLFDDPHHPVRRQAETIIRIVDQIKSRPELRVLSGEEAAIRAAMTVTLPAIRAASNADIYRVAQASLRDMDRFGGVKVKL